MPLFLCSRIEKREYIVKGYVRIKEDSEDKAYEQFERELKDPNFADIEYLETYDISDEQCEFVEGD